MEEAQIKTKTHSRSEGDTLSLKWKSVATLQQRMSELSKKTKNLEEELAHFRSLKKYQEPEPDQNHTE